MGGDRVDVAIVGAGPTGLTAAHLCRRLGLSAVVLERREGPQRAPAAHVINGRSFEIWRHAGIDLAPILAEALSPDEAGLAHWAVSLGGEVIGSLPFERQGVDMLDITPTPLRNLSQHRLEPKLLDDDLDVRYSHRWVRSDEHADGVHVAVEGPDGEYTIDARYQLAADGAASGVRRQLGIEMDGPRSLQSFVMVHVAADFRPLVGDRPGVLWFIVDPASGGTFISHGIDREWVYMHAWDPDTVPIESFTPERFAVAVSAGRLAIRRGRADAAQFGVALRVGAAVDEVARCAVAGERQRAAVRLPLPRRHHVGVGHGHPAPQLRVRLAPEPQHRPVIGQPPHPDPGGVR